MGRLKLGVLISGRGSNLQSLIDHFCAADAPAEIVIVISNNADAGGLTRARTAGLRTVVIDHRQFDGRTAFDAALDDALTHAGVDLVCLAGFMRLLTTGFVERWRDRMVNIHPSLLPAFKGLHTHARAIEAGVRIVGCTVHYVRPEMDEGPILVQAAVPVLDDDDEDSLSTRVLAAEHRCYPAAIRLIAEGRVRIEGERAIIVSSGEMPPATLFNPA
jgi:phosphoribosylglycinamide formyltransferase-1